MGDGTSDDWARDRFAMNQGRETSDFPHNCFDLACPRCHCQNQLEIQVKTTVIITPAWDGRHFTYDDPDWEDNSKTTCTACGWKGRAGKLLTEKYVEPEEEEEDDDGTIAATD